MINVLCWNPESTTCELRSEHMKSIFLYLCTHTTCSHQLFQSSEISFADLFLFLKNKKNNSAAKKSSGPVVWVQGAWRVPGCIVYVACVGLNGSHICEAVYHKCDTCKGEYMPSKTEQNDAHFRASLVIPPSVTSYCRPPLPIFLWLFPWGPDHNECNQSSGVIFLQSYYCGCFTEESSWGLCVCFQPSDLWPYSREYPFALCYVLVWCSRSAKVPKCPVLHWITIRIPKGILTIFAFTHSSVQQNLMRLPPAHLWVGGHQKTGLRLQCWHIM